MSIDGQNAQVFRFEDPRQQRIYRRLLLVGPGPAAFYRDACWLMQTPPPLPLQALTHVVSHLLREIESAIRDVLEVVGQPGETQPPGQGNGEIHRREILSILGGLGIDEDDPIGKAWLDLTGSNNPYGLSVRAHRAALAGPRPLDEQFRQFWNRFQGILDAVLDKFESNYFTTHDFIDRLLENTSPARVDAQAVRNRVPNNRVSLGYFFERASSNWLAPLHEVGFFKSPPPPEDEPEKGTIAFPMWPESRYLARVASNDPQGVCEVVLSIPDTENYRVHEDIADAACSMPPHLAARIAEKETAWLSQQNHLYSPLASKLGTLLSHLAKGGETPAALALARAVLAVLPDPRFAQKAEEELALYLSPEPRPRCEEYHYKEILETNIPDLVEKAGLPALEMLCTLLLDCLRLSTRPENAHEPCELSYTWRPAVEEHEQNRNRGVKDLLVSSVRDAAESLMASYGAEVLRAVEQHEGDIFKRIGLHLRRKWPDVDIEGTCKLVTDPEVFDSLSLHHELFWLLHDSFHRMPDWARKEYFRLVERGPDFSRYRYPPPEEAETAEMREEVKRFVRHWRYMKLIPVQAHLRGEWQGLFAELKEEFGQPDHPDLHVVVGTEWTQPESPKSAEQLQKMGFEEIVEFLKTWEPSGKFEGPSLEGMGRELSKLVSEAPERFAPHAELFEGLVPAYIRELICRF